MVTRATAKKKGAGFEYDVLESIQQKHPEAMLTKQRGFQLQYDIEADTFVVECKRHRDMSFQEASRFFVKLSQLTPEGKQAVLIYQNNNRPAMAVWAIEFEDRNEPAIVECTFEDFFGVEFKRHTPIRKIKK